MPAIPNRVVLYPKDVENITGRCNRTARRILSDIRKKNNKPPTALVSISEFCEHTGIKKETVIPFLT